MHDIQQKKLVGIVISIVLFLSFLIGFNYFKFDILNILWVIISIFLLISFKKNNESIQKWSIYLLLATCSLILSFYAYCFGDIKTTTYICLLIIYLLFCIVFKLNLYLIVWIIIFLLPSLFELESTRSYMPLYFNFIIFVVCSFKDLKIYSK